jgi:cbb3-type cytochrome oxidase cytochrome c subunit
MAARDDTYRNQHVLDIIFALSSIAMLLVLLWMFAVDYDREYKTVQRKGREIEVALLRRQAHDLALQGQEQFSRARQRVVAELDKFQLAVPEGTPDEAFADEAKRAALQAENDTIRTAQMELNGLKPTLVRLSDKLSAEKANRDTLISQRDTLLREGAGPAAVAQKEAEIAAKNQELAQLEQQVEQLKADVKAREDRIAAERQPLTDAITELERQGRERDRLLRFAKQREGDIGTMRAWPILEAFSSPYKVRQDVPDGLLIDYNFKQVQRVDRCATCHMFIDRQGFDRATLQTLAQPAAGAPAELTVSLKESELTLYCNHPRLDLFVGSNSPHPVEKFGCTTCHSGQGGATTFNFAYHSPDLSERDLARLEGGLPKPTSLEERFQAYTAKKQRWQAGAEKDGHNWHPDLHPDYMWDFPMVPGRFLESSCLKCHHQVTDLIRTDGREEAPKLLKGYRLVRDLGCFGCHEIGGYKGGRPVGPDLRLEPYPPLDELTPLERSKLTIDPTDPPGTMRKIGPSLRRLAEKTDLTWTVKWLRSPRTFRPNTRMPHFFGLTNNHPTQLADDRPGASQLPDAFKGFPDAEIQAIAFYLLVHSESYLAQLQAARDPQTAAAEQSVYRKLQELEEQRRLNPQRVPREVAAELKDLANAPGFELAPKVIETPALADKLTKEQLTNVLFYLAERERMRKAADALARQPNLTELAELKGYQPDVNRGKELFMKRGCLACHTHGAAEVVRPPQGDERDSRIITNADFGPDLTHIQHKLGPDRTRAEKWLYYWLTDPKMYHPRTFMPNPQLEPQQRLDIVAWLLSGGFDPAAPPAAEAAWARQWAEVQVSEGDLERLAASYLEKVIAKDRVQTVLKEGLDDVRFYRPDADERFLAKNPPPNSPVAKLSPPERVKYYVGKKSIARYGCYGCHDIPGFETAKPIGTPLNDWGKKDSDRLAFENILAYVRSHYRVPDHGDHGHASGEAPGGSHAEPYDPFFWDALNAHRRDGFLFQKLREPRSYDYEKYKDRPWDDRLKMPQFRFAHTKRQPGESDEEYHRRAAREEHEAVEAVMTFILGLVAEPVPMKFVHQPRPDRLHEVKGLQVLEKYNCISCHTIKPGAYEVVLDDEMRQQLQALYNQRANGYANEDIFFPEHASWRSPVVSQPTNRLLVKGLPRSIRAEEGQVVASVELWEALRFPNDKGEMVNLRAGDALVILPLRPGLHRHAPYGGEFATVLRWVLDPSGGDHFQPYLRSSVPPPLFKEGQKVQPQWAYEFLRRPHVIRPLVATHLRMPQFNLSPEEIEALVNYFIAVDRLENPALGLEYLTPDPPQRDPGEQARLRAEYRRRLAELDQAKPGTLAIDPQKADYFEFGWKMLTNDQLCIKCHDLGGAYKALSKDPKEQGPPLTLAPSRLRPDFVERWVANPIRILPHSAMPNYQPLLPLDPTGADLGKPPPEKKPEAGKPPTERLTEQERLERVRALRDALMSHGSLTEPGEIARKALPPPPGPTKP